MSNKRENNLEAISVVCGYLLPCMVIPKIRVPRGGGLDPWSLDFAYLAPGSPKNPLKYVLFGHFQNLWFGKPMVCVRVAFHDNDRNHENDENDEDDSDSYKQGVEEALHAAREVARAGWLK